MDKEPDTLSPFSVLLCDYRKTHGLSQEELADKLKVGLRTIQRWEAGNMPPLRTLTGILNTLGLHYSEKMIQQWLRKTYPIDPPTPSIQECHYCEQLINTYNAFDFSGFERVDSSLKDVPLEKIFLRLTLLQNTKEQDQLSEAPSLLPPESISLSQALSKHLILIGEPGGGKSSLLKWLAITFAQGKQQDTDHLGSNADHHRIPLLVELKNVGEPHSWFSFLPSYITQQDAFRHVPPVFIEEALENGQCLVLFDGLDEIADRHRRTKLLQSLRLFAQQAKGNRLVISSRPAGINKNEATLHPLFHHCQIERFTPEEVLHFFSNWYDLDSALTPKRRQQQVNALFHQVQIQPHLLQLTQTPLLCTMLLLLWRTSNASLPQQRASLYDRFCCMLLDHWEGHHTIALHDQELAFSPEEQLQLLARLAYKLHTHAYQKTQSTQGTKDVLLSCLTTYLQETRAYATPAIARHKAEQLLELLSNRSGLLQYQGKDLDGQERYAFTHLTFQEYLAAYYLATLPQDDWIDAIMTHLHDAWWLQVYLLTIGIISTQKAKTAYIPSLLTIIFHQYPPATNLTSYHLSGYKALSGGHEALFRHVERYLNWTLGRNLSFCFLALAECADPEVIWQSPLGQCLLDQAEILLQQILAVWKRAAAQKKLLQLLLKTLLQHRKEKIAPLLLQQLADTSLTDILAEYLSELSATNNKDAIQVLLQGLQSSAPETRKKILKLLGPALLSNDSALFQAVAQGLHDSDETIQYAALASLEKAAIMKHQPALQALLEASVEIPQAIHFLGDVAASDSPQTLDCLLSFAHHTDTSQRNSAIRELGKLTSVSNPQLLDLLHLALGDASEMIRRSAANSFIQLIADGHTQALQIFITILQGDEKTAQHELLTALGGIDIAFTQRLLHALQRIFQSLQHTPNEHVLSTMLQAFQEPHFFLQCEILDGLTLLATNGSSQALQALLLATKQGSFLEPPLAFSYLGPIAASGQPEVFDLLLEAQHNTDVNIQSQALRSLGWVAADNKQVLDLLIQSLENNEEDTRQNAVEGLGQVIRTNNQQALVALLKALGDNSPSVVQSVVRNLAPLADQGNEEAIQGLLQALKHENGRIQEAAFQSLCHAGATGQRQVFTRLVDAIQDYHLLRLEVALPLAQAGGITNEQLGKALIHDLRYADDQIRKEAIRACREVSIHSPQQLREVLRLLTHHMHAPREDIRGQAILSLEYLLDGQVLPLASWVSIHRQRKHKAHLRRCGYLSLLFAGMLFLSGIGAIRLGYLPDWTLFEFGLLSFSLIDVAIIAFRLGCHFRMT